MHAAKFRSAAVLLAVLAIPALSRAVIVIDAGGLPSRNLSAPAGGLADSGWQYQGDWVGFSGTPIAPNYFITAKHVGGSIGQSFVLDGTPYTTIASYTDPNSDLAIWQVSGTFSNYAPLYTGSSEVGQGAVIFGRGVPASSDIVVGGNLKGWGWVTGSYDGLHSWGRNTIDGTITDPTLGRFLVTFFDRVAGQDEGQLAYADSGGGVFINDGGTWKLAGINYGVDGPYKYALTDPSAFSAALFDQSGLYWQTGLNTFGPAPSQPSAAYLTSISGNLDWINATVPEPATISLLGIASLFLLKRHH